MKREKVLVQSPGKCERLVREREKENKSDGGEGAQSLSVFSSGGVSLLWSQLLYWPLGGKANRTFVLDTRNHMACSLFVDDPLLFERAS